MKKPLVLNLVWAGVAGAAFYTGMKFNGPGEAKTGAKNITPVAAAPSTGKGLNPQLVSKDSTVLEFFKEYGLDSGVPLTPEKMKSAMLAAIRESDPVKSQMMFARLMEELTAENAPAALAMIRENVSGFESMRYMGMLAYKWGEKDPETAMKELLKGDERGGRMSQTAVLSGWAATDPQAAIAWLSAFEGDDWQKGMMSGSLINGLARSSPEEALKYALTLKDDRQRSQAAETIAREMIRAGGTEKATAWLASLTDPEMKKGAFQTVADQLLKSDPAKAAEYIKQNADQDYARNSVGSLASTLAKKDVQEGFAFADELTGKAQAKAYGSVINEWLDKDRGAAAADVAKYVEALPAGDNKDAGVNQLARQAMRDRDASTAIAWAASIQDPEMRSETLVEAGRQYMRQDREEATAWLASSGLSAEDQAKVTNPPQQGPGGFGGFGGGGGGRQAFGGGGAGGAGAGGAAAGGRGGRGGRGR